MHACLHVSHMRPMRCGLACILQQSATVKHAPGLLAVAQDVCMYVVGVVFD